MKNNTFVALGELKSLNVRDLKVKMLRVGSILIAHPHQYAILFTMLSSNNILFAASDITGWLYVITYNHDGLFSTCGTGIKNDNRYLSTSINCPFCQNQLNSVEECLVHFDEELMIGDLENRYEKNNRNK